MAKVEQLQLNVQYVPGPAEEVKCLHKRFSAHETAAPPVLTNNDRLPSKSLKRERADVEPEVEQARMKTPA